MNNEVLVRREARKDREQRRSSAPGDLPEPRLQDETRRTVDLGHSSNGPSWIDPAEIRVITTESRLGARLNCLLQQNRPIGDSPERRAISSRWAIIGKVACQSLSDKPINVGARPGYIAIRSGKDTHGVDFARHSAVRVFPHVHHHRDDRLAYPSLPEKRERVLFAPLNIFFSRHCHVASRPTNPA